MKPIVLLLFALLSTSTPLPAHAFDADYVSDTRAYLDALQKVGFSGVVLIAEGEAPVLAEGYGLANREEQIRWTPSTVATIGSITKQFTAAAIMKLVERGDVAVGDHLDKYFDGVPEDKRGITLHHLLTHSSGIIDPEDIDDFDKNTREEYVRRILAEPLAYPTGEGYEYANANFSLLGAVIELVTNKSYEVALRELILGPAGLGDTGYTLPQWDERRLSQGYRNGERWGTILERPMGDDGPYWALRANGGIHSTALDMFRWARTLLDDTVLDRALRDAMWTPHVDEGGGESFYGYGWVVMDEAGHRVITHNGGNGIHFADLAIVPDQGIVAFIQCNVIADFRMANRLLGRLLRRALGDAPYPYVPTVVAGDAEALAERAASYVLENGDRFEVRADGDVLRVTPHGWRAYASVHGPAEANMDTMLEMTRDIDRIVGAYVSGDFKPLYEAYRGEVPMERLQQTYAERARDRAETFGPFEGYEVIGTGGDDEYYLTCIRFKYARDEVTRAYVWDRAREKHLLGVTPRPIDVDVAFYPVAGGEFASFDPDTGASVRIRFEPSGDLRIDRAPEVVAARR